MTKAARTYIAAVISAGAVCLAGALFYWSSPAPLRYSIYLVFTLLASAVKLRLPRMEGTYSLNCLFLLGGVLTFSFPEVVVAALMAAIVQAGVNYKKRPSVLQLAFNGANLVLSTGAGFLGIRAVIASGLEFRPAIITVLACLYFVINTATVSGVLSLVEGKPLAGISQEWYRWSFPYYLIGAAVVGLLSTHAATENPASWLVLVPLVYLLHFYAGVAIRPHTAPANSPVERKLSKRCQWYIIAVICAAGIVLVDKAATATLRDLPRFAVYLLLAVLGSMLKIRLPGMRSTMSLNFVMLLVAIIALPSSEVIVISALAGAMQCYWRPRHRPTHLQVAFNAGCLIIGTGVSSFVYHGAFTGGLGGHIAAAMALATAVLYLVNTFLVSAALSLMNDQPLLSVWHESYFWSLPYYSIGGATAGLVIAAGETAGWLPSLLVLPVMALVYVSYSLHADSDGCRPPFRTDAVHRSEVMPISVPN
jgi:hypothetical protein